MLDRQSSGYRLTEECDPNPTPVVPVEMLVNAPLDWEPKIAQEAIQENIASSDKPGILSRCFSMLSSARLVTSVSRWNPTIGHKCWWQAAIKIRIVLRTQLQF